MRNFLLTTCVGAVAVFAMGAAHANDELIKGGLAYADGKIFLHQADTRLVAVDAKDGKVVWQAKNGDPAKGETGTSAPMVIKDKVLIGISGGEFGVDCHVTAYDLKSGRRVWRGPSSRRGSPPLVVGDKKNTARSTMSQEPDALKPRDAPR